MSGAQIAIVSVAAVLALIAVLIFLPISFYVKYEGGQLFVDLRYFFIKKRLYPAKQKAEKSKDKSQGAPKEQKQKSKESFFEAMDRFFGLISSGGSLGRLAVSFHRVKFKLLAKVGGEDASETAVNTGKMSAYFHTAAAVLANYIIIKKREIEVCPDYNSEDTEITFKARFWSRPASYLFNIHKIVPLLLRLADALPPKKENKGEKNQ